VDTIRSQLIDESLPVPPEFPVEKFQAVRDYLVNLKPTTKRTTSKKYLIAERSLAGWDNVLYRSLTCIEQGHMIAEILQTTELDIRRRFASLQLAAPLPFQMRRVQQIVRGITNEFFSGRKPYEQERTFFVFFVSGLSALESFTYSMYTLGAALDKGQRFQMALNGRDNQIDIVTTADAYRTWPTATGSRVQKELDQLAKDKGTRAKPLKTELARWERTRNLLIHQASPLRISNVTLQRTATGPDVSYHLTWENDDMDVDQMLKLRAWFTDKIADLVTAADEFVGTTLT